MHHTIPWIDPLALARNLRDETWVLLYSGVQAGYSGRYSFLCRQPKAHISSSDFDTVAQRLTTNRAPLENAWFGYLGYGLKHALEELPPDVPGPMSLPHLQLWQFSEIIVFDHAERVIQCPAKELPFVANSPRAPSMPLSIQNISSNMSRGEYLQGVTRIIDAIHAGEFYQANLTRKFNGSFADTPDTFALFETLCAVSPAPYSAYLKFGDTAILSSSPERFLTMDASGHVTTRPIKGTAARHADPAEDARARDALATSAKDRAENLMIVDLMRNDLARSCTPGSVRVEALHEVTTHATVHHMSSTVSGHKREDVAPIELVKACFPPGSMTGAPKIRAMQACTAWERQERGIYSGAIGWFGGDGSLDLSVVIRTLIVQGKRFEFQVGGGIVADSKPEAEWRETLIKARGIARALGLDEDILARL